MCDVALLSTEARATCEDVKIESASVLVGPRCNVECRACTGFLSDEAPQKELKIRPAGGALLITFCALPFGRPALASRRSQAAEAWACPPGQAGGGKYKKRPADGTVRCYAVVRLNFLLAIATVQIVRNLR